MKRPRPVFSEKLILKWSDAHKKGTGQYPKSNSGPVDDLLGENWRRIDNALRYGHRGLPGGSSLAQLLQQKRGVPNVQGLRPLTEKLILSWADSHRDRDGRWPTINSGPVKDAPTETWRNIDAALRQGLRGLPGRSSLAQLLSQKRGTANRMALPKLSIEKIRKWATQHHRQTGQWPRIASGRIPGTGEAWSKIQACLWKGARGLRGGMTLARLLVRK